MEILKLKNKIIAIGDIVTTTSGKAKLSYIKKESFTSWVLLDHENYMVNIDNKELDNFII